MRRSVLRLAAAALLFAPGVSAQGTLTTRIGRPWFFPDGGRPEDAPLSSSGSVAADSRGALYLGDCGNRQVFRIDSQNLLRVFAGSGGQADQTRAFEIARRASLLAPCWISVDANRNVFIADGNLLRAVDAGGFIRTVAGSGLCGYSPDGTAAADARLIAPSQPAFDSLGRIYFLEGASGGACQGTGRRVRMIDENGRLQTVAGAGASGYSGDGGLARFAEFRFPDDGGGLAFDSSDNLYIADTGNRVIRRVRRSDGILERFAGVVGEAPNGLPSGDGGPALQARFEAPLALAFDATGALFIADGTRVRRIAAGTVATVAGTGQRGFRGDNGPATSAWLSGVRSLALTPGGDLLLRDGARLRRVRGGVITTIAGSGRFRFAGDDGPAEVASLNAPGCIFFDTARAATYFCDTGNNRVRRVDSAGVVTTVAGNNTEGEPIDGALAVDSHFPRPAAVAVDAAGNLLVATAGVIGLYRIDPAGQVTRLLSGAQIGTPTALAIDGGGNLYLSCADQEVNPRTNRIFRYTAAGDLEVFAGSGEMGFAGDGGPATLAALHQPTALAIDAQGRVFLGDSGNRRIRVVQNGIISTFAGTGIDGTEGDNGPALAANFRSFGGLAFDRTGNLFLSDPEAMTIRRIGASDLRVTRVAGVNARAYEGDGRAAAQGSFHTPLGLAFNAAGELLIADSGNHVVRAILPTSPAFGADPLQLIFDTFNGAAPPASQDLSVAGAPGVRTVAAAASSAGWLAVEPATRNTPNRFTVRANSAGLSPGTYPGFLTLTSAGAVPESREVPVTLVVLPRTDVTVTAVSSTVSPNSADAPKDPLERASTAANIGRGTRNTLFFRIGNGGPDVAENVRITPNLSPELTLLESSFTGAGCRNLVCPEIAPGQTAEYRATVAVRPSLSTGSVVTAAVTAVSETNDRNTANNVGNFALTVTGAASSARYTLTTQILSGFGNIQLQPLPAAGGTYLAGEPVIVTAIPGAGCTFAGWAGDLSGSSNPAPVLMTSDRTVLARFNCPTSTGLQFVPLAPCRVMDTRAGEGRSGAYGPPALSAGGVRVVPIAGQACGVPAGARAFSLNVTVVPQSGLQFLTLWPSGRARPLASTLNAFQGQVVANAAIVEAGADGAVSVFVTDPADVILDINGYFQ